MNFKDYINESEVKLTGSSDVVDKLKVLKLAVDDWLKATETSYEGNSAFIITKAIKNVNSHVKKTAESIVNAVNMEKKYKGK
tara:strand:+ start:66 stop:311 length:246 start_codon:yes stop_codon:yes gene_type:complete